MLLEAPESFRLLLAFILGSAKVGGALLVFLSGSLNFIAIKEAKEKKEGCFPNARHLGFAKLHLHQMC